MYQYDDPSGVAVRPPSTAPGVPSYPTDGNPVTNSPPSIARAEWFCAVMDELMNLTAAGGVAPSKTVFNQLVQSLAVLTSGAMQNLVDTSTVANAMVATATLPVSNPTPGTVPAIAAYQRGLMATITPAITNTSSAVTLTINGLGALPFIRSDSSAPQPGDLPAGRPVRIYCTGTQFMLLAPTVSQLAAAAAINYATDISTVANIIAAALTPALTAYQVGTVLRIRPANANTGPTNASINGLAPVSVTRPDGSALVPNDIRPGKTFDAVINAGPVLQMLSWPQVGDGPKNPIAGAAHAFVVADAGNATWRSNAGAPMTDTLPGATAGALPAGWSGTIINADPTALLSIAVGPGSTLTGPAVFNGSIVLGPGQKASFAGDGTNYTCYGTPPRARLTAGTTLYVGPGGSDTTGTGLTAASAFATAGHAYAWAQAVLDLAGQPLTIDLLAGNYPTYNLFSGPLVGQAGAPAVNQLVPVIFNGAGAANTSVSSANAATGSFYASNGAVIQVQNMSCGQSGAAGQCLLSTGMGTNITVGPGMAFTATALAHMDATSDGAITILNSYTISGGAQVHWLEAYNGKIYFAGGAGLTVTLTGTPAFSGAFASAVGGGIITPQTNSTIPTFVGTATGPKYAVSNGAIINTNGAGVSAFPGSTAGSGTGYF